MTNANTTQSGLMKHVDDDGAILELRADYDRRVNFALEQNDVPVIQGLYVDNMTSAAVANVQLRVSSDPAVFEPWTARIAEIDGDSTYKLHHPPLQLSSERLARQTERQSGHIIVEATIAGELVARETLPFEVLAYNEWSGLASLPALLCAFVLPNQPAVARVLKLARAQIEELTGDPSLCGYQEADRRRPLATAGAMYAAIQQLGITYINPPASFEQQGQKIRLPDQVLNDEMGTCLDLSVMMAACLEQAGLHPFITLVDGHAFPGVWLDEHTLPEPSTDDPISVRKRVDAEEAVVFDSSAMVQGQTFQSAVDMGRRYLDDVDAFLCTVDVKRARLAHIRPLPIAHTSDGWQALLKSEPGARAGHQAARLELPELRAPAVGGSAPTSESPATRLDRWKSKLLDLTLRNRLLHLKMTTKNTIPLLNTNVGRVEDDLASGRRLEIVPRPTPQELHGPRSPQLKEGRTGFDVERTFVETTFARGAVVADLPPAELQSRMTKVYRSARANLQETGSNSLYLALGMLDWYESESADTPRRAPIVLLPIEITRGAIGQPFGVRVTDDDPRINVTLLKKLETDFGIDVRGLDELPEDASGLDIPLILDRFRKAVMNIARWEVSESAALSEFSFAKHLMWVDLEERTQTLLQNPLFEHIMEGDGRPFELEKAFTTPEAIDVQRLVKDDLCVVDADSSQLAAIFAAKDGNSFVLQGPPGTGKSQTITNLVAQLVADGKTVLFVSEKMAALEVVHRRLQRAGLAEFCLELHSNKSNKKLVLEQLAQPFQLSGEMSPIGWDERADELQQLRQGLNAYVAELHRPGPHGISAFQAAAQLQQLVEAPDYPLEFSNPKSVTGGQVKRLRDGLHSLEVASRDIGDPTEHAWFGTGGSSWTPRLEREIATAASDFLAAAEDLVNAVPDAAQSVGLSLPSLNDIVLNRIERAIALLVTTPGPPVEMINATAWSGTREQVEELAAISTSRAQAWERVGRYFRVDVLDTQLEAMEQKFARWAEAFFVIAFIMLWSARRSLKQVASTLGLPANAVVRDKLRCAIQVKRHDGDFTKKAERVKHILGGLWKELETDWSAVDATMRWVSEFRSMLVDLGDAMAGGSLLNGPEGKARLVRLATEERELLAADKPRGIALTRFSSAMREYRAARATLESRLNWRPEGEIAQRFDNIEAAQEQARCWRDAMQELRAWRAWIAASEHVDDPSVRALVSAHTCGRLSGSGLLPAFERGLASWWMDEALETQAVLRDFSGTVHSERIERYRQRDKESQRLAQAEVRARLAAKVPDLNGPGEVAIVRAELKKQRRHLPIRRLFSRIPHTLTRLKPCVLMSPLSVAQYLDPTLDLFDVVVFDEASQIPPWDAIGAIARGRQMVVVGDSKQLPPTNFFQKSDDDIPDDDDMVELESILDECVRAGFHGHSLGWHYRSRHETLIAFSNHHYYDNGLVTFPAAEQDVPHLGVKWRHVEDGFYDKGRSRTNQGEARAVVSEVERRLTEPSLCGKSIGIVTFSQAQQTLILDLLDELRQRRPEIEPFFGAAVAEPVFVKNLENVQGDERDVMMFSICYGPDRSGRIAMNFGPLNRDGGERRLNVAITRARELLLVFSTITPDQIDLARTRALGVEHLKTFLDYAKRGPRAMDEAIATKPDADVDSPFEQAVCRRLRAEGWQVDLQVGCAGYRIDVAVSDQDQPGSYLLGIECDGTTYRSARCARDRDRIRESVLESLGWRLFRVWSLDWWHDANLVMKRLGEALRQAQSAPRVGATATNATAPGHLESGETQAAETVDIEALLGTASDESELPEAATDFEVFTTTIVGPREQWDGEIGPLIARRLSEVVEAEGPIEVREATRRVSEGWGATKATAKGVWRVLDAMRYIPSESRPTRHGEFLWPASLDPSTWRGFRLHPNKEIRRSAEYLPPHEVANAAEWIVSRAGSIEHLELVTELSRLFGYASTGKKVRTVMEEGIQCLVDEGRAKQEGASLRLTELATQFERRKRAGGSNVTSAAPPKPAGNEEPECPSPSAPAVLPTSSFQRAPQPLRATPRPVAPGRHIGIPHDFAIIDLETTGLSPQHHHRIVEVAVLRYRHGEGVVDSFVTLVNPERDLGPTHIHGITGADVQNAPTFREIAGALASVLAGAVVVAHNARFDVSFIEAEYARAGFALPPLETLCTMGLPARVGLPSVGRSLVACCEGYGLPYDREQAHGALHDARSALALLRHCVDFAAVHGPVSLQSLGCCEPPASADAWPPLVDARVSVLRGESCPQQDAEFGLLTRLAGRLSSSPSTGANPELDPYFDHLDRVLEDHVVTPEEAEELVAWARGVGYTPEQLQRANVDYLRALVLAAWEDGVVTAAEQKELGVAAHWLGVDEQTLQTIIDKGRAHAASGYGRQGSFELAGKTVCFTGQLRSTIDGQSILRSRAEAAAESAGMIVAQNVTKKLDVLVLADPLSQSSKAKKARAYGTRLVAETVFWRMVGVGVD